MGREPPGHGHGHQPHRAGGRPRCDRQLVTDKGPVARSPSSEHHGGAPADVEDRDDGPHSSLARTRPVGRAPTRERSSPARRRPRHGDHRPACGVANRGPMTGRPHPAPSRSASDDQRERHRPHEQDRQHGPRQARLVLRRRRGDGLGPAWRPRRRGTPLLALVRGHGQPVGPPGSLFDVDAVGGRANEGGRSDIVGTVLPRKPRPQARAGRLTEGGRARPGPVTGSTAVSRPPRAAARGGRGAGPAPGGTDG